MLKHGLRPVWKQSSVRELTFLVISEHYAASWKEMDSVQEYVEIDTRYCNETCQVQVCFGMFLSFCKEIPCQQAAPRECKTAASPISTSTTTTGTSTATSTTTSSTTTHTSTTTTKTNSKTTTQGVTVGMLDRLLDVMG